jgi:hypothetical protein
MVAVGTVLIAIFISLLITRVATVALTATGLSHDAARFQARSALSGVGFTTTESEAVVNHPVRRRIILVLMLLGNAGLVTILASTMLTFADSGRTEDVTLRLALLVGGLAVILIVARSEFVDRHLSRLIAKAISRWTDLEVRDYVRLLQLTRDYGVTELEVEPDDWLADRTLAELDLSHEGVLVLGMHKRSGEYLGAPRGGTVVRAGDVLVLYGRTGLLAELDRRRRDESGDVAHREAVSRLRNALDEASHGSIPKPETS